MEVVFSNIPEAFSWEQINSFWEDFPADYLFVIRYRKESRNYVCLFVHFKNEIDAVSAMNSAAVLGLRTRELRDVQETRKADTIPAPNTKDIEFSNIPINTAARNINEMWEIHGHIRLVTFIRHITSGSMSIVVRYETEDGVRRADYTRPYIGGSYVTGKRASQDILANPAHKKNKDQKLKMKRFRFFNFLFHDPNA